DRREGARRLAVGDGLAAVPRSLALGRIVRCRRGALVVARERAAAPDRRPDAPARRGGVARLGPVRTKVAARPGRAHGEFHARRLRQGRAGPPRGSASMYSAPPWRTSAPPPGCP